MNCPLEIQEGVLNPGALRALRMFGMNIKRRRRRKKKIGYSIKNAAFTPQSHSANPFLQSKKGKMAPQANFFLRCSPGRRGTIFFFVPQCRQGLPKCANAMHFATTVVASTCSTARSKVPSTFAVTRTILYYYLFCCAGGERDQTEGSGVETFLFIMAWYRTPRAECELFPARGPARPPRLFPLRKTLRKINFPRIKSLEKIK